MADAKLERRTRPPRERFFLTVEAAPSPIAPEIRLRQGLKILWRRFQLRCTAVKHSPDRPTSSAPPLVPIAPAAVSSAATSAVQPVLPAKVRKRRRLQTCAKAAEGRS